jgi:hypothetical protein
MTLVLVGPSHIPRLRHALEIVGLPRPTKEIVYLGDGGYPVWNKEAFDECCEIVSPSDQILLIIADFRFGNSILSNDNVEANGEILQSGHTHIKRELCTVEADHIMKKRCIDAIAIWKHKFGSNLTILHWTLAMRTVKNRILGHHVDSSGVYRHPVWNVDDAAFSEDINELSLIQHDSDLSSYDAFTIDNDLHPSTLGYLYITSYAVIGKHSLASDNARKIYLSGINALISSIAGGPLQGCILCGNSSAISTIKSAMPISARSFLSKLHIEMISPRKGPPFTDAAGALTTDRIVFISNSPVSNEQDVSEAEDKILATFATELRTKVVILFWDALAMRIMQWRARTQRSLKTNSNEQLFVLQLFKKFWRSESQNANFYQLDKLIEYGAGGSPTFWGICQILTQASCINNNGASNSALRAMQIAANDVWLTQRS